MSEPTVAGAGAGEGEAAGGSASAPADAVHHSIATAPAAAAVSSSSSVPLPSGSPVVDASSSALSAGPSPSASLLLSPCSSGAASAAPSVTLKLRVAGLVRRFRVPASITFDQLTKEIGAICKLHARAFRIAYQMDDGERVMSDDSDVAAAFAAAAAEEDTQAAGVSASSISLPPTRPVRLSIHMIARVASGVGRSSPSLHSSREAAAAGHSSPATAAVPSTAPGGSGSSAVALAHAAMTLASPAPPSMPINTGAMQAHAQWPMDDTSSSQARPTDRSPSAPFTSGAHHEPLESRAASDRDESLERAAAARVYSILTHPHATWDLDFVRGQMNDADDLPLRPLVTQALLTQQMQVICTEREERSRQQEQQRREEAEAEAKAAADCATPASPSAASSSTDASASASSSWPCALCTFVNLSSARVCEVCLGDGPVRNESVAPAEEEKREEPDSKPMQPQIQDQLESPQQPEHSTSPARQLPEVDEVPGSSVSPVPSDAAPSPSSPSASTSSSPPTVCMLGVSSPVALPAPVPASAAGLVVLSAPPSAVLASAPASAWSSVSASGLPPLPSQIDLQLLADHVAQRVLAQLQTPSIPSVDGSPSSSLTASALMSDAASSSLVAPLHSSLAAGGNVSPADLAGAMRLAVSQCMAEVSETHRAHLAEMQRTHLAEMQRAANEQMAAIRAQKERSKQPKPFATIAHRQRRRTNGIPVAGARGHRGVSLQRSRQFGSTSSLSSSYQSSPHSSSAPASPALSSSHSSPILMAQFPSASMVVVEPQPTAPETMQVCGVPACASASSSSSSPASAALVTPVVVSPPTLASSCDLDAHSSMRFSCLSLDDLAAAGTASCSVLATDHSSLLAASNADRESAAAQRLPANTPILHTIHSAGELERMEETAADAASIHATSMLSSAASLDAPALPVISELSPTDSQDAVSSPSTSAVALSTGAHSGSSSSSASSSSPLVSSPLVDLCASADLCDSRDVRFPSVAAASADRDAKLDALAQLGYTNRIFASTLLDVNGGDMTLTASHLKQFYAQR